MQLVLDSIFKIRIDAKGRMAHATRCSLCGVAPTSHKTHVPVSLVYSLTGDAASLETLCPPSFNPVGLITAQASLDDVRYHDPEAFRKLLDESIANMRKIPGVQNAAVALSLPYQRAAIVVGILFADGPQVGKNIVHKRKAQSDVIRLLRASGAAGR